MLYFFFGSDRDKARSAMNKAVEKAAKRSHIVRITDAHSPADLQTTLSGPGMFSSERVIVLDSIAGGANEEMRTQLLGALEYMKDSKEDFFMLEGALDAATRKQIEKFAEKSEKFDAPKKEKDNSIFALASSLQKGDRKALWVGLMREFAKGAAPEAVHGLLFWGAKRMFLNARGEEKVRAENLIAALAEIPHEARRKGEDLEYALERFVLSKATQHA
jgi:hypothetical protein